MRSRHCCWSVRSVRYAKLLTATIARSKRASSSNCRMSASTSWTRRAASCSRRACHARSRACAARRRCRRPKNQPAPAAVRVGRCHTRLRGRPGPCARASSTYSGTSASNSNTSYSLASCASAHGCSARTSAPPEIRPSQKTRRTGYRPERGDSLDGGNVVDRDLGVLDLAHATLRGCPLRTLHLSRHAPDRSSDARVCVPRMRLPRCAARQRHP